MAAKTAQNINILDQIDAIYKTADKEGISVEEEYATAPSELEEDYDSLGL